VPLSSAGARATLLRVTTRVDDQQARLGPSFDLVESKLRAPLARPGIVPRRALVERLLASSTAPLICVVAPPGYGKTTLLAQWAERRSGVAWVSLDRRDNDPVVLLSYLAAALDRVQPIDPAVFQALASPGASVAATVVPRLVSAIAALTQPVALALDHLELLENQECLDAVAELALRLPAGSQLVLALRRSPALPVALLRAQGRTAEIGAAELAMDQREARALLDAAGAGLSNPEVTELTARTEGWPVGLYLAALAHKAGGPQRPAGFAFTGDDRFVADYLDAELLAQVPAEQVVFLTRTAVLERMSGPLCDAVLAPTGSGRVLESLEDSNLLLVPLDRRREWFRYHHLFHELLLAELERREPEQLGRLHVRAATWWEADGRPEVAIEHAQAAGDVDRVARLVAGQVFPTYSGGRVDTARRWLEWFEDRGLVEHYPPVAVLGAWIHALVGRPAAAERWADGAGRRATGPDAGRGAQTPPDGSTMDSYLAMLRALLCRDGVGRMRADAEAALAGLSPASPWRAGAMVFKGAAELLDGQADRADATLAHAVEVGRHAAALPAVSTALAERCLLAIQGDDWGRAEALASQALGVLAADKLGDYIMSPLVHAVAARPALHRGRVAEAREHLARAARVRPLLTYAVPWGAVQSLVELGRSCLALDDVAGARAVLVQARDVLRLRPDLGVLPAKVEELGSRVEVARGALPGPSSLSTAELRLLPLLSTHLSFREIGERLYISQHTVKTQVMSVYRKLGASSRSQAVHRLQEIGVLGA
jgi:LuxR family transcriptional regulator, maltose regulon positive regulatory protein